MYIIELQTSLNDSYTLLTWAFLFFSKVLQSSAMAGHAASTLPLPGTSCSDPSSRILREAVHRAKAGAVTRRHLVRKAKAGEDLCDSDFREHQVPGVAKYFLATRSLVRK